MKHTFLLQPGSWKAQGTLLTPQGAVDVDGETRIEHTGDHWTVRSRMGEFTNDYEVPAPAEGDDSIPWSSENPAIGALSGTFTVVGDSILSQYASADGQHQGLECLRQVSEDHYEARGTYYLGDSRVTSWVVTLRRG